jgi:DNA-binding transcriptional MerR regulator
VSKTAVKTKRSAPTKAAITKKGKASVRDDGHIYSIGDLSREFGVTLRTLRFYEDRGLIKPKRSGLTRLYNEAARARVQEIIKATRLGFTLTEILALMGTDSGGKSKALKLSKSQITRQLAQLEEQKLEIEKAISQLKAMQRAAA